ncbi:hypothetical protein [Paraburkholderia tagetis]|uniref:Uncharacterized protein n=1 Tax=Paraburkholderia tagetis TaxID=2913261 RepID=A0A9X1UJM6_9BURK|nr:hypothetical protein [Paraburkholderia tagetis]MCG5077273.1 hypothetical protein [Paraburkholderia tagetis]
MLDLKKPRAWAGSLVFALSAAATALGVLWLLSLTTSRQPNVACIVAVSLAVGLGLEAIRRVKVAELRRNVAKADDRAVMKITINDIEIGEVPEPLFANMKLVVANDARNYVAQFSTILGSIWRHTVLTLAVTAALLSVYLAWQWLVNPADSARAILSFIASTETHGDPVQSLANRLHLVASSVASIFAMLYMLLGCVRMTFGAPLSVSGAFHADLQRRVRLILGTPSEGAMSFRRVRLQ